MGFYAGMESPTYSRAWSDRRNKETSLVDISKMGTKGLYTRNVWRALKRKADAGDIGRCLKRIRVPAVLLGKVLGEINVDILQPHLLFSVLYHRYPREFKKRVLGGGPGSVSKFWNSMHKHPAYPNPPMWNHPQGFQHKTHGVPISIHGMVWRRLELAKNGPACTKL